MASSFLGFNTLPFGQQHQQQQGLVESPQRIGAHNPLQSQQVLKQQQGLPKPAAADELQRLTREYEAEAARIEEQLSLCGIQQQSLGLEAVQSLKLLARLACALQLTQATPQLILAAWAMLLVKHSKATTLQHKLQSELAALAQTRATAQQKLAALQRVLADVQAAQHDEGVKAQRDAKLTRHMQDKAASNRAKIEKNRHHLDKGGFTQEVTHTALLEKHSQLQELQQKLADLQQQLNRYHQLPATLLGARMKLDDAKRQLEEKQDRFRSQLV